MMQENNKEKVETKLKGPPSEFFRSLKCDSFDSILDSNPIIQIPARLGS